MDNDAGKSPDKNTDNNMLKYFSVLPRHPYSKLFGLLHVSSLHVTCVKSDKNNISSRTKHRAGNQDNHCQFTNVAVERLPRVDKHNASPGFHKWPILCYTNSSPSSLQYQLTFCIYQHDVQIWWVPPKCEKFVLIFNITDISCYRRVAGFNDSGSSIIDCQTSIATTVYKTVNSKATDGPHFEFIPFHALTHENHYSFCETNLRHA